MRLSPSKFRAYDGDKPAVLIRQFMMRGLSMTSSKITPQLWAWAFEPGFHHQLRHLYFVSFV
jgi:hypothetical protein